MSDDETKIEEAGELWGVEFDHEALGAAATELPAIRTWISGCYADPARAVRIGQLLALPTPATMALDTLLKQIAQGEIADSVRKLGEKAVRLRRLRVLVAMELEQFDPRSGQHALLASSACAHHVGPERWYQLVRALDVGLQADESGDWPSPSAAPAPVPLAKLSEKTAELKEWIENILAAPQATSGLKALIAQLEAHRKALGAIREELDSSAATGRELAGHLRQSSALQRLLWWGQAKYSWSLRRSLRRIPSLPARALVAVRDAAISATRLPVEPSAAYVVETLRTLDIDPCERRSLRDWMEETRIALQDAELAHLGQISSRLEAILHEAPIGLVAAFCLRASARPTIETSRVSDLLGIDLATELDRGEWTAWLFRECLLDERLKEP